MPTAILKQLCDNPFVLDPSALPAHFDGAAAEKRWNEVWQRIGAYAWDAASLAAK